MLTLVFILEEDSMRVFLEGARNRLPIPEETVIEFRVAEGYRDVRPLVRSTMRSWRQPNTRFVVLCDQDSADCRVRKDEILSAIPEHRRSEVLVRIVCRELEAWYFGDLGILSDRYRTFRQVQGRARFRSPDTLRQPSKQIVELTGLGKTQLAKDLGPILDLEHNRSHSLRVFLSGLRELLNA